MRINNIQTKVLKHIATELFGPQVRLLLFGSRTDDLRRGGDIDLYVTEVTLTGQEALDAKLRFLVKAKQQLGDQRIDLILAPEPGQPPSAIHRVAEQTGILL